MRLIESSNDYRKEIMSPSDLLKAIDMYWGLSDPIEVEQNTASCLLRFGNSQFDYQRRMHNLLPRTFAIYRDLWPTVPGVVEIVSALRDLTGLGIEEILIMCFAYSGRAKAQQGFFRTYDDSRVQDEREKPIFTQNKQKRFVDWISCDYRTFRELSKAELKKAPDQKYEKFRFNPLAKYPTLRPDINPKLGEPQVYIVPVPRLLVERVTRGLYFELADYFMGEGKKNPFRTSFGYVFERYIGELLKESLGGEKVLAERSYDRGNKLTTDWIILQGERAIFIEVKQSGLFLEAKTWGDLESIRRDVGRTIGQGVKQLFSFERDVRTGKYAELSYLSGVKEIEHLVVTYDHAYFSNSILREQVRRNLRGSKVDVPENFHWHVISVDELEEVLGMHGAGFPDLLRAKRLNDEDDIIDFGDYLARYYSDKTFTNPYLDRINEEFFKGFEEL
jgi:hypothetical protein